MDGRLGIFRVRIYGRHRHVGVPRSQTLLWEEELEALPRIFAAAGLDSSDDPTDHVLVRALERHARHLRAPTRRALARPRADVLRSALLDVIRAELADWDGSVADVGEEENQGKVYGSLRLFLELHLGKLTGAATIRCALASPYPDHALTLTNGELTFSCDELLAPWSSRLSRDDGRPVNAAELDWSAGLSLTESTLAWRFTMRSAALRVFESAESLGLPGWVEVSRLDRGKTFLIACRERDLGALVAWGDSSCSECVHQNFTGLLPEGWHLLKVRDVQDDEGIRSISPTVGLPNSTRIRLVGGVKSGRGAKYYAFAPPQIQVSGVTGNEIAMIDGHLLDIDTPGLVSLPELLPRGKPLTITVREEERLLVSQTIILLDDIDWTATSTASRVDVSGQPTAAPGFCGAFADSPLVDKAAPFQSAVLLPSARKAILLGRRPGEVCDWPAEPWPSWEPVWAITPSVRGRKQRPVVYCGSNTAESRPKISEPITDRRMTRRWKEQIWTRRKHNVPPENSRLRALWNEFMKAGRG